MNAKHRPRLPTGMPIDTTTRCTIQPGGASSVSTPSRLEWRALDPYKPQTLSLPGGFVPAQRCAFANDPPLGLVLTSRNFVTTSLRITAAVISLVIASLAAPSAAYAKRMGSAGRTTPRISQKAPAAPVSPKAPVAPATSPAVAAPAAAVAPATRGSGMMGTMGAAAVGAVAGTMAGSALAGGMSSDKDAKAKEAEAVAAEQEAKELQLKADEAKRKAEAARATVK